MKEKYYKVHKDFAARAGLTSKLRQEVDNDFLMLSEKDVKMISFSFEERLLLLEMMCPANDANNGIEPGDDENVPDNNDDNEPDGDDADGDDETENEPNLEEDNEDGND